MTTLERPDVGADVALIDQLGRLWPGVSDQERDETARTVFHLRSQGVGNAQIARELELSLPLVGRLLRHGAHQYQVPDKQTALALELYRLDRWQRRVEQELEVATDAREVAGLTGTLLAISARRARYTGLEEATLVDVRVTVVEQAHREIAELLLAHRDEIIDAELVEQDPADRLGDTDSPGGAP